MARPDYDLIVIGAGPGGYVAAIRAAQLGMKAAVVEREHLGGICLNWGCIPTKALLRSAEVLEHTQNAKDFGIDVEGAVEANVGAMVARSRKVSAQLNGGVGHLLKKNKVDIIWGEAKLLAPGKVAVAASTKTAVEPSHPAPRQTKGYGTYSAKGTIIATGARPRVLPGLEPDGEIVMTYFEAMVPKTAPESLLVVGSGAIGMEFASFYAAMGTKVTVVELLSEVLPQEDPEIARLVRDAFKKRGIEVLTSTKIGQIEHVDGAAKVQFADSAGKTTERKFDKIISAVGVVPNIEGLGLEALGVDVTKIGITTNDAGATSCQGIYAIGDVAGAPMLAHKAEHEAVNCVEAIANGSSHALDKSRIPGCTYCQPQVASVGLTEDAAREAGHKVKVGRFPFAANGKAVALGEKSGLVKTVFDEVTGELLGAHLVGPEVTELIHGFVTAIGHETTDEHLLQLIYPHPTLSEAMHESVLDARGTALHI
ncbi:dihydrolipoyl dehydrogenase [Pelagibius sp. Alg239-R121]|uniref:dihydrolipoyl dehydrogenase n=1 Tax=Pelagibius sp. Alg239-R121 TaxID=2993448 RepID=UPI0024A74E7E|nr:dihydrolipoyl dehydrogenase [Pelagibius sp. Alg239-R121]